MMLLNKMNEMRKDSHQCEQDLGYDSNGDYRGFCAETATIRCDACGKYFCNECWPDHLEMTVVTTAQNRQNEK